MYIFLIIAVLIVVFAGVAVLKVLSEKQESETKPKEKPKYQYTSKQFFMTRAEHEFYDALIAAVGSDFYVFAQVHLPTIVDHTVKGQDWRAALAHINRKSVDFVLCDKAYISPKLAIELDDKSHERYDRQERDKEVERILRETNIPLLRVQNNGSFDSALLAQQIKSALV